MRIFHHRLAAHLQRVSIGIGGEVGEANGIIPCQRFHGQTRGDSAQKRDLERRWLLPMLSLLIVVLGGYFERPALG